MLDWVSPFLLRKPIQMYKVSTKSVLCGNAIVLVRVYSIWMKFAAQDNLIPPVQY